MTLEEMARDAGIASGVAREMDTRAREIVGNPLADCRAEEFKLLAEDAGAGSAKTEAEVDRFIAAQLRCLAAGKRPMPEPGEQPRRRATSLQRRLAAQHTIRDDVLDWRRPSPRRPRACPRLARLSPASVHLHLGTRARGCPCVRALGQ
jgi:hypothetical protein